MYLSNYIILLKWMFQFYDMIFQCEALEISTIHLECRSIIPEFKEGGKTAISQDRRTASYTGHCVDVMPIYTDPDVYSNY